MVVSLVLGLAVGAVLVASGLVHDTVVFALCLTTTALGTLLPILRDAHVFDTGFGRIMLAVGAVGEFGPVVAVAVLLTTKNAPVTIALLVVFVALSAIAALVAVRVHPPRLVALLRRHLHTTAQLPVRISVLLVFLLVYLTLQLGLDVLLGTFAAGIVVRLFIAGEDSELVIGKLEAIGFGYLIPIFFIVSGVNFDLEALVHQPGALARVPVFLGLFLVVRGTPALLLYRKLLDRRDRWGLAFFSATGLPLIVVITTIGVSEGKMRPVNAAALVAAGMVSVLVYPLLASDACAQKRARLPEPRQGAERPATRAVAILRADGGDRPQTIQARPNGADGSNGRWVRAAARRWTQVQEVASGITVGEALARVRGEGRAPGPDRATSPGKLTRFRLPLAPGTRRAWSAKELAAVSLGMMAFGAVVLGAQSPGAHSARPAAYLSPAAPATAARSETHPRSGSHALSPLPVPVAAVVAVGAPGSSATAAPSVTGPRVAGRHDAHAPRSSGDSAGVASPGAGSSPGSVAAATTTSTSTTSTTTPGGSGAPSGSSASVVEAWDIQYGSNLVSLSDDISTVDAAEPSASGDYSAVVASWQQLASDVGAAQAVAPVPDAALEATWSAALEELSTACADWLASLTSTSPPSGSIADESLFDAGTAEFAQGTSDLATAQSGITAT